MSLTAPLRTTTDAVPIFGTAARPLSHRLLLAYESIAHRETLACVVVLILTLGIRAALLPWYPPPLPAVHDEFSYLLASDTYSSGRLANPPHPMWQHFETFHELMQPVYASKYPPLQGLVLAFGQKFFHEPWVGVYLSTGIMCAAMCWMLQGWLSPNLAFLGALLFLSKVGVFGYWMNSYWGGAIPAIGGALVLGAFARVWRKGQTVHWITFGIGLAILMHSRPWEGAVLTVEVLAVLAWAWRNLPLEVRSKSLRAAIPVAAILLVSLGALLFMNVRVTGSPLTFPHALYDKQYIVAPVFAFLPLRPEPVYRHKPIRELFTGWHVDLWNTMRTDPVDAILGKISDLYIFFIGLWPLLIPPLIWPYPLKTPEERVTVLMLIVFLAVAILPLVGYESHYVAPIAGLLYVRLLQTLSRLNGWRPGGRPLGPAVAVFFVTLFGYQFVTNLAFELTPGIETSPFAFQRNSIAKELAAMPGRQLVLVRYPSGHVVHDEWVWNRADIDASQTVWAREMGSGRDEELLTYYPDRKVWLLEPDHSPLKLVPYSVKDAQP